MTDKFPFINPVSPTRMLDDTSSQSEDYHDIADKVRKGEYFREARAMYDLQMHDPMAERYMYVFITAVAIIILLLSLKAMQDFYPLNNSVPIIISQDNNGDDVAHILPLLHQKGDKPNEVLLRFLVEHYVVAWEEYEIGTFDRDVGSVKSQSSPELVQEFNNFIDPHNAESPITLYQRHTIRKITVLSMKQFPDSMEVVFEAALESRTEVKKSRWRANISFQYGGLALDQSTGNPKPIKFVVTKYHSKRLQDVR